jgi:hypothetical protein
MKRRGTLNHNTIGALSAYSQSALGKFNDMADDVDIDLKGLAKTMLARHGGVIGIVVTVAPAIAFILVDTLMSLPLALIAAAVAAIVALGLQLIRRQSPREAIAGFVIAGASASVAALTGQAKGFFLIGTLGTGAASAVLFATVLAGRPLAGRVLNRIAGGRPDWRQNRRPLRIYSAITLGWAILTAISFTLHVWFYLANLTAALAVMAVTGPFLILLALAGGVVVARRTAGRKPASAA